MKRSILAVFLGVLAIGVVAVAGDSTLQRMMPGAFAANGFSADPQVLLISLVYTVIASGLGGWVTAMVSRRADHRDAYILAALQFVMTLAAESMLFDRRLIWYYAIGLPLTVAAIAIGGRMARPTSASRQSAPA